MKGGGHPQSLQFQTSVFQVKHLNTRIKMVLLLCYLTFNAGLIDCIPIKSRVSPDLIAEHQTFLPGQHGFRGLPQVSSGCPVVQQLTSTEYLNILTSRRAVVSLASRLEEKRRREVRKFSIQWLFLKS